MKKYICAILSIYISIGMAVACVSRISSRSAHAYAISQEKFLQEENAQNLYCLAASYPQIKKIIKQKGNFLIELHDGQTIPYMEQRGSGKNADLKQAMSADYPLEPDRSVNADSPGRARPYAFFEKIYGSSPKAVESGLVTVALNGGKFRLSPAAAAAFNNSLPALENILVKNKDMAPFLKTDGGYKWRRIAGEANLSAHSFGIAFDIGANVAPYWRWSKLQSHPMQKTYPGGIVKPLEDQGFIWGGKWREYDLMHFEYRPELICKAKLRQALQDSAWRNGPR